MRRITALRPRVEVITAALLDDLARADDPADLGETFAPPLPITVICELANFDPRVYDDPQRLDVTRLVDAHGDGHVGFGHGVHHCLGAALARQEGEVALRGLFGRFPGLAPAVDLAALPWVPVPGARRLAALPVHVT